MINFRAIVELGNLPALRRVPVIAVDVGFATTWPDYRKLRRRTVFVEEIWSECLTFAQVVDAAASVLHETSEAVLILECPLSSHFNNDRIPVCRDAAEAESPWYRSAGALTALAGLHFLEALGHSITRSCTIHLLEGIVVGEQSVIHAKVARHLIQAFLGEGTFRSWAGSVLFPLASKLPGTKSPMVLRLPPDSGVALADCN